MQTPNAKNAPLVATLAAIALVASCSLEEPSTPFTGTSSASAGGEGSTVGAAGGTSAPSGSPAPPSAGAGGGPTGPEPSTPSANGATVVDPLTNGTSVGEVSGGRFTNAGWQVTHRGNFIRYRVQPMTAGFVEWENLNLTPRNPQRDLFTIMGMWDPSRGAYRENPFRVHIRKLDTQGHNPPYVRMRFISNGDQHDVGWDFLDWNPSHPYQWRLQWGPGAGGNEARVFLDGQLILRTGYGPAYRPEQHWIELGVEERAETIVGMVFRNLRIGPR